MTALDESISALRVALASESSTPVGPRWSRRVRRRLGRVRRQLVAATERSTTEPAASEADTSESCWLSPRTAREERRRQALLTRIGEWEPALRESDPAQPGAVRGALLRLASDLEHYQRRSRLLAFDTVAMELGGSE